MPRAYTKSGSIEKYESILWNKPTTPVWVLPTGASKGSVGNPNSNGNYYISMPSQSNYTFTEDSSGPYSVTTYYNGVTNIVKFSRAENTIKIEIMLYGVELTTNNQLNITQHIIYESDGQSVDTNLISNNEIMINFNIGYTNSSGAMKRLITSTHWTNDATFSIYDYKRYMGNNNSISKNSFEYNGNTYYVRLSDIQIK